MRFTGSSFCLELRGFCLLYAPLRFRSYTIISRASNTHPVSRGHGQEAKRGSAGGPRLTRHSEALGSLLLPCAATGGPLLAVWCLIGATPRGQPWTPAVTLPHRCDGLSARRMAVLWTFREPSLCRQVVYL